MKSQAVILVDWDRNYSAAPKNEKIACIATGRSLEELRINFERSLKLHLKGMSEDGEEIPEEFTGDFEIVYYLTGKALMHYVDQYVTRKALARETGINLQQLSHYAKGHRNPRPEMQERILEGIRSIGKHLTDISS